MRYRGNSFNGSGWFQILLRWSLTKHFNGTICKCKVCLRPQVVLLLDVRCDDEIVKLVSLYKIIHRGTLGSVAPSQEGNISLLNNTERNLYLGLDFRQQSFI